MWKCKLEGAFIKISNLEPKKLKEIKKALTYNFVYKIGKKKLGEKNMKLYVIIADYIIIPTYTYLCKPELKLGRPKSMLKTRKIDIKCKIEPKTKNQKTIISYLRKNLPGNGLTLVLGTGEGKSFISAKMIEHIGTRTLIVVHNTKSLNYWYKDVIKPNFNVDVGRFYSKEKRRCPITIVTISSLVGRKIFKTKEGEFTKKQFFGYFSFAIFDEVTEYCSEKRANIFWDLHRATMLGLTATPDEKKDRFDDVYKMHVGPLLYANKLPNFEKREINWKGKVFAHKYEGPQEFTRAIKNDSTGFVCATKMDEQFSKDPERNALIAKYCKRFMDNGRNVYIFSGRIDILHKLQEQLSQHLDEPIGILSGGVSEQDEQDISEKCRIILVSYQYGGIGMSITRMDTIIFATPRRANMRQILGRILRLGSDESIERIIVDIIDVKTSIKRQYPDRKKIYKEKNYTIINC